MGVFIQPPFWATPYGRGRDWPAQVSLSLITPPTIQALTLAEAKLQVKVDGTESDSELTDWLAAAQFDVEQYTQRVCITQAVDVRLNPHFPRDRRDIEIPIAPLLAVTGIDYIDASGVAQTMDPSLYDVDTPKGENAARGRVMLKYGQYTWPYPPAMDVLNGATIHTSLGYGPTAATTPARLKTAMRLLIGGWWKNREAGEIIRGSADTLPFGVERELAPFRRVTVI